MYGATVWTTALIVTRDITSFWSERLMEKSEGPKSCKNYKMGRPRAVPYKDCGSSYDEGWLDEICTERRDWDE